MIDYGISLLRKTQRTGKYHLIAIALNKQGHILSKALNSYTQTHPKQAKYAALAGLPEKHYLHAEIAAIVKAKVQVDKLVIVRIGKNGQPMNAKPCPICELAIKAHGIRSIEYST